MLTARLKILYSYLQILSIDIVIGACAGMLFFDRLIGADLRLLLYLLLALAVWCIYTFDHLLDARQIKKAASTPRHAFHQKHFKRLAILLAISGSLGMGMAFYFLKIKFIVITGLALGSLILLSFTLLKIFPRKWVFLKEISIATLYVGGIMLAPYFHNDLVQIPLEFWLLGFAYVLVAWFNTLYLGISDRESDKADGLYSFALAVGKGRSIKFLYGLMAIKLLYIFSLYLFLHSSSYFHISIVMIMAVIHCIVFLEGKTDKDNVRRRLDACFMLPFLLLLI
ncbi:MAG TPA: UbiA family prenyltransferase [Cyclobacteriaceae bacterium]|nr:UbiA family prenyltransferase [Cyclobacteriaceae bacterium]